MYSPLRKGPGLTAHTTLPRPSTRAPRCGDPPTPRNKRAISCRRSCVIDDPIPHMIVKLPNGLQRLDVLWDPATPGSAASAEASSPARRRLPRSRRPLSRTAMRSSRPWGEVKRPLATARRNIAVTNGSEPAANVTDMGLIEDATGRWHPAEVSRGHSRFPCA